MLRQKEFMVILTRLFLGYLFLSAGLCKLTHGHFGQIMGPPLLEDALAKYGLRLFVQFVAVSQVVCGMLLMSQRFSTIGAVMLLPMNVSIIAVTISMNWTGTPYVNAVFTLMNVLLLIYDWHKLKILLQPTNITTVRLTPLDAYCSDKVSLMSLAFAMLALFTSQYSFLLTNIFAILFFALTGYSIIRNRSLNKLCSAVIILVALNMIVMTLAKQFKPFSQQILLVNTLLIFLLTLITFIRIRPRSTAAQTPGKVILQNDR